MKVRLTPRAQSDLADIRKYTTAEWGRAQARTYLSGLGNRLDEIGAGTAASRSAEDERAGYYRARYQSHIIFFKRGRTIEVVRIMHERMDFGAALPD